MEVLTIGCPVWVGLVEDEPPWFQFGSNHLAPSIFPKQHLS